VPTACGIERRCTSPLVRGHVIRRGNAAGFATGNVRSPEHHILAIDVPGGVHRPRLRLIFCSERLPRGSASTRRTVTPIHASVSASAAIGVRDLSVDSTVPANRSAAGTACTRTACDAAPAAINAARAPVGTARTRAGRGLAARPAVTGVSVVRAALTGAFTHTCSAALRVAPALACVSSAATRTVSR